MAYKSVSPNEEGMAHALISLSEGCMVYVAVSSENVFARPIERGVAYMTVSPNDGGLAYVSITHSKGGVVYMLVSSNEEGVVCAPISLSLCDCKFR